MTDNIRNLSNHIWNNLKHLTHSDLDAVFESFDAVARVDERAAVIAEIESWLVDEKLTVWKTEPYSKGDKYCCKDGCERCGRVQGIEMGKNELRAELRAKLVEMKGNQ